MSVLHDMLGALRLKRQVKAKTLREQFESAVRELAKGKQVDLELVSECMDALDISDKELEELVKTQSQRFADAAEFKRLSEVENRIPALEAAREAAQKALDDAVAKLSPKVQAARDALKAVHTEVLAKIGLANKLRSTVLDSGLLDAERELLAQRKAVGAELYEMQHDVRMAKERIQAAKSKSELAISNQQVKDDPTMNVELRRRNDVKESKEYLDALERQNAPLLKRFDDLRAEQLKLDREQQELDRRKLEP
jgi:hypothetical protein